MALHTRRAFLAATAASVASLAGCSGSDEASTSVPPDPEDVITNVEFNTVRFDVTDVLGTADADQPRGFVYLRSTADVDGLEFSAEPIDGEVPIDFFRAIDYDTNTGLVVETELSACHHHVPQYAEWRGENRLGVQFCRTMRDPSVECDLEDRHAQITAVSVPVTLDTDPSVSGFGVSGSCELPPGHMRVDLLALRTQRRSKTPGPGQSNRSKACGRRRSTMPSARRSTRSNNRAINSSRAGQPS